MKTYKRRVSWLLTAALMLGLCAGWSPAAWGAGVDITEKFTDPVFRAAMYEVTGKSVWERILDTDVAGVRELSIIYPNIQSLAGLEYFTGLTKLFLYGNQLTSLPTLPSNLKELTCADNKLTSLPELPSGLTRLDCGINQLTSLPKLPSGLETLNCFSNQIESITELPPSLTDFTCYNNQLTSLPDLPSSLNSIDCSVNQLTSLPTLPPSLTSLYCWGNHLAELDLSGLTSLTYLDCSYNDIPQPSAVIGFPYIWGGSRFKFYPQNDVPLPPLPKGISSWAVDEVSSLDNRDIIPIALRNDFQGSIRRDEFTALLVNLFETANSFAIINPDSPFSDISATPYKTDIEAAYDYHLIDGTSPTKFTPFGLLTREQTAKLLYTMVEKIDGATLDDTATPDFTDNAAISAWATPYVAYAQEHNLMLGTSTGKFDPQGYLTREQAMLVVERLIVQYGW